MGNLTVRARQVWPFVATALAVALWWPAGFAGRASWMHLSLMQTDSGIVPLSGGELLLGSFVAAALVAALVSTPGLRLAIAVALTAAAWMLTETDVVFARGERGVLAGLVGLGMLLGLVVGSQAMRGMLPAATLFAVLAGLTPATWPRGLLLAVALALPFWVATSERAAETAIALARVVAVWLVSVVFSMSLWAGFASLEVGALADPKAAALDIGRGFVSFIWERGIEIVTTAPEIDTPMFWITIVAAIALALIANAVRTRATQRTA
ncbi:hypothetical protein [Knoellia sp. LjRoot47]|uniref:hypothetical protein n=1 Tax=Knoellia sp. LjRoot47 TaxID=3342330 RepID=UPI003ED11B14